jgi:hypothetical protein
MSKKLYDLLIIILAAIGNTILCCLIGLFTVGSIGGTPPTPALPRPTLMAVSNLPIGSYTPTPTAINAKTATASPPVTPNHTRVTSVVLPTIAVPTQVPTYTPLPVVIFPEPDVPNQPSSHPAGASALCRDGTYSYSAHRRGTCSHHGGVSVWLRRLPP